MALNGMFARAFKFSSRHSRARTELGEQQRFGGTGSLLGSGYVPNSPCIPMYSL